MHPRVPAAQIDAQPTLSEPRNNLRQRHVPITDKKVDVVFKNGLCNLCPKSLYFIIGKQHVHCAIMAVYCHHRDMLAQMPDVLFPRELTHQDSGGCCFRLAACFLPSAISPFRTLEELYALAHIRFRCHENCPLWFVAHHYPMLEPSSFSHIAHIRLLTGPRPRQI